MFLSCSQILYRNPDSEIVRPDECRRLQNSRPDLSLFVGVAIDGFQGQITISKNTQMFLVFQSVEEALCSSNLWSSLFGFLSSQVQATPIPCLIFWILSIQLQHLWVRLVRGSLMLCHHSQGLIARENKTIGCAKRFREHHPLLQNPELYYVVCRKPSEGNLESESVTRKLEEILSFHQPFFCS